MIVEDDDRRPVRESLSFLQPGDKDILFQNLERRRNDDESYFALAAFRLLFPEQRLPALYNTKETALDMAIFENIHNSRINYAEEDVPSHLYPTLNEYKRDLMIRNPSILGSMPFIPSENFQRWLKDVEDNFDPYHSTLNAASLFAADPEKFITMLTPALREKLLAAPENIRTHFPPNTDPEQSTLLAVLAHVRLMFPDQVGPESLTVVEQEAMHGGLENIRSMAREGASGFSKTLFYLALVEAPRLVVDESGLHLAHVEQVSQSAPLPQRSVL